MGAIGDTVCPLCSPFEPGLIEMNAPMSQECRKCHYPIEDLLNSDHVDCLRNDTLRCASLGRGIYNFHRDVHGVLSPEAQAQVAAEAAAAAEAAEAEAYNEYLYNSDGSAR